MPDMTYRIAPNFRNFCNYTVSMKILFMKIFDTRLKVSLVSIARVVQVFKATVSVLHSLQPLCSVLGCDFVKALAMGCSVSINSYQYAIVLTHVIACMLQTFFNVAPSCRAC